MQNFQDTFETLKRSFISECFFNLHDYTFNKKTKSAIEATGLKSSSKRLVFDFIFSRREVFRVRFFHF